MASANLTSVNRSHLPRCAIKQASQAAAQWNGGGRTGDEGCEGGSWWEGVAVGIDSDISRGIEEAEDGCAPRSIVVREDG